MQKSTHLCIYACVCLCVSLYVSFSLRVCACLCTNITMIHTKCDRQYQTVSQKGSS